MYLTSVKHASSVLYTDSVLLLNFLFLLEMECCQVFSSHQTGEFNADNEHKSVLTEKAIFFYCYVS